MQLEGGKARRHAFEEIIDVGVTARYYARRGPHFIRSRRRRGLIPLLTRVVEHRHPIGVVGIISPWNYPLTLAVSDALPALLAGNAVVLKPAEKTSLLARFAADLVAEAGIPDDVFQIVTGTGETVAPRSSMPWMGSPSSAPLRLVAASPLARASGSSTYRSNSAARTR
jgi:succinate-semialdehyde dehydrogenase/glutarate-semialdehyde dehydrogenase